MKARVPILHQFALIIALLLFPLDPLNDIAQANSFEIAFEVEAMI